MRRGSYVHAALHQFHQGIYDEEQPHHRGYIGAGIDFLRNENFVVLAAERVVVLRKQRVCGTLDVYGYFRRWPERRVIIDWKTGDVPEWTALQLAAYDIGLETIGLKADERIAVRLYEDGTYDPVRFAPDAKGDRVTFAACVNLYRWREKVGLLKEAA